MDTKDLMQAVEFDYHSIVAANPEYKESLWDFFIKRGFSPDDIWEYSPEVGREASQQEPDWL